MRHFLGLFFIAFAVLITSCGKTPVSRENPTTPPPSTEPTGKQVVLRLFGAPWCTNCKSDFPQIRDALAAELAEREPKLRGELYVTTGTNAEDPPTQQVTDAYRDFLKLPFAAVVDEWPWKTFRLQVQKDRKLPAAVVFDAEGNVLKVFKPGATSFQVPEIVSYVKGLLK